MNEFAFWVTLPIAIGFYFYVIRKERARKNQDIEANQKKDDN